MKSVWTVRAHGLHSADKTNAGISLCLALLEVKAVESSNKLFGKSVLEVRVRNLFKSRPHRRKSCSPSAHSVIDSGRLFWKYGPLFVRTKETERAYKHIFLYSSASKDGHSYSYFFLLCSESVYSFLSMSSRPAGVFIWLVVRTVDARIASV